MDIVRVEEAERIILAQVRDYGTELIPFESALGRVLAEDILADRDLPPCNKATMDGIAILYSSFEKGNRSFQVKGIIAAGEPPFEIENEHECVEIMTGAALPGATGTVIRYEDVKIENGVATVNVDTIKAGQNIHRKGRDKKAGDIVAFANTVIDPALISMAASVGKNMLLVKKLPKVVIISTGDELVGVTTQPTTYQVKRSNSYMVKAVLQQYAINADMLHIPDNADLTKQSIKKCLEDYEVIILSGGISMGKFDYVPTALKEMGVTKLFHKVLQRPGKPFWFGSYNERVLVFAFPGNPVSTFLCLHRYFIPWLESKLKIKTQKVFAILSEDVTFLPPLQYFVQVRLGINEQGQLLAAPDEGNGSGDFANLLDTDAFMELPAEQSNFSKGEVYRIWPFKRII